MIMLDGPDGKEWLKLPISPLECARLVAHDRGFYVVDVEPFPEKVTVKCSGHENMASFTAKGKNITEACDAVVRTLW